MMLPSLKQMKLTFPKTPEKSNNPFFLGRPAAYQIPSPRAPTIVTQIRTWNNRTRAVLSFLGILFFGNCDGKMSKGDGRLDRGRQMK